MKFAKEYLASIEGVSIYPMISLVIFFLFFTALFTWVITAKKPYLNEMSQMPLDATKTNQNEQ
jgi:hypothetical protein